jgi:hypothetical protein
LGGEVGNVAVSGNPAGQITSIGDADSPVTSAPSASAVTASPATAIPGVPGQDRSAEDPASQVTPPPSAVTITRTVSGTTRRTSALPPATRSYAARTSARSTTSKATRPTTSKATNSSTGGTRRDLALSAQASASYISSPDTVSALNNGTDPLSSADIKNPRWTTWPQTGTHWAALTWSQPQQLGEVRVYFFDDRTRVRLPTSWRLEYWDGQGYANVPGTVSYLAKPDLYNVVTFSPITTSSLRIVLESGNASVGLLRIRAYGA